MDPTASIETTEATFAGFITTTLNFAPEAFAQPDRLVIGDFYVAPDYRGSGLADKLVARAAQAGRESGCSELALNVDVDNKRARAYYERLGFETARHRLRVPVSELALDLDRD
jgi:Acetyltransferases